MTTLQKTWSMEAVVYFAFDNQFLRDKEKERKQHVPFPDDIIDKVCNYMTVERRLLNTPLRAREIVVARQLSMYYIRKTTGLSLKSIGGLFGGRDHSTVIHAVTNIENLSTRDETIQRAVEFLDRVI